MFDTITLKTAPEVKRVIRAAFPSYRKQRAYLSAFHPVNINSYWDGRPGTGRTEEETTLWQD